MSRLERYRRTVSLKERQEDECVLPGAGGGLWVVEGWRREWLESDLGVGEGGKEEGGVDSQ